MEPIKCPLCNSSDVVITNTTPAVSLSGDGNIKELSIKKEQMPKEIIAKVRESHINTLREERPVTSLIIYVLITLYCLVYFIIGIVEHNGHQILYSYICSVPFELAAIVKLKKRENINQKIEECKSQSLLEFKQEHRELFCQYSQYN